MSQVLLVTCFYAVCFVIVLVLAMDKDNDTAQKFKNPSSDFSRRKIVQATVFHARTKRELSSTRRGEGLHHPEVMIKINIDSEEYVLDLRLNEDLISEDHVISYQEDGKRVQHKPSIKELDICQYSGVVRDKPNSWAAVSTCLGVRGVIYDGHTMKHIEPIEGDDINSNHFLYDPVDLNVHHKCGSEESANVTNNTKHDPLGLLHRHMNNTRPGRHKREAFIDLRGPYRSTYLTRYVELVLVVDHRVFKAHGEDDHKVNNHMRDIANIINSMYTPLNIYITLVGVEIWKNRDEIRISSNSADTLKNFEEYLRTRFKIKNDNAQLITMQNFDDSIVGKAQPNVMCTYKPSGGIATYDSDLSSLAFTITHEMGHNFGMNHDDDPSCKCRDQYCIMTTQVRGDLPTQWSSCSIRSLMRAFDRGADFCLRNIPKRLFPSPTCGNGFLEYGEECDCGHLATRSKKNECLSCCDPRSCRFRSNATCASGECCDLKTCRPMSAGTVCRAAHKECDLPEHCTGHSEFCPADVFKMDSTPCGTHHEAYCVGGSCKSHKIQCQMLWGPSANNSHTKCYQTYNVKGNKNGNCGHDRKSNRYKRCSSEDVLCGRLQCQRFESLQFGNENYADLNAAFETENRKLLQCQTANIDLGVSGVDLGLVPDGAKCGDNKMCYKQRCRPLAEIRANIAVCPAGCNGHGVCNSKGHCHCNPGFAPPDCIAPGPGGSYDSGPTTKVDDPKDIKPIPRSKRPGDTIKPKEEGNGSTYFKPIPHPKWPENTATRKDPRSDGPTNGRPTPRPKRPDDTARPIGPRSDGPTNGRPTPRPKRPDDTARPIGPRSDGPTNGRPTPRPKRPDDTARPIGPRSDDPRNSKPIPRPYRPYDTTEPKEEEGNGPTNRKPYPRPKNPYYTARPNDPKPRPKWPYDTPKPQNPTKDYPTHVKPIPRPKQPYDTTKPKNPESDGQRNDKAINPRSKRPDDTIRPKDQEGDGPIKVIPFPRPKGSDDTTKFTDVGPTIMKPDGSVDTESNNNAEIVTDPSSAQWTHMVVIYVIFLGILPLILLVLFVIYFKKIKELFRKNKSRILSLDCLKKRRTSNYSSFFTKFPRIAVDASSHRIFFVYNNTFANQTSNRRTSDIRNTDTNMNVNNMNFSQQTSPFNIISQSCDAMNKNTLHKKVRKASNGNIINGNDIREPSITALIENDKKDDRSPPIYPIRPKVPPPKPPKPKLSQKKVEQPNIAASGTNKGMSSSTVTADTSRMTVKERVRLYPLLPPPPVPR